MNLNGNQTEMTLKTTARCLDSVKEQTCPVRSTGRQSPRAKESFLPPTVETEQRLNPPKPTDRPGQRKPKFRDEAHPKVLVKPYVKLGNHR